MRRPAGGGLMRTPSNFKQGAVLQSRKVVSVTKAAPVGGWNARDSIAAMPESDAVILDNVFPETDGVALRPGYSNHVTGFANAVESLMGYNKADGTQTLFAAAGTSFFDATSAGAVGAAVVTGLTNARWNSVNFTNTSAISYLCAFNGVDSPRYWDGSSWITVTGASSPGITGVTTSSLKNPWVHKRRLWMVQSGTLSAWYLPIDAVGGAATEFALYGLFKRGGSLLAGGTWTIDGGEGLDDYMVFVTTEGEVAVYQGTNPASDFVIRGVWHIGEPIGDRCMMKLAGDLLIITKQGVFPLSKALQSSQVDPRAAITDKIDGAMTNSGRLYGGNFGWDLSFLPERSMLVVNIPTVENTTQEQYAMNVTTGAWGRYTDLQANCWVQFNKKLYFGSGSTVELFGDATNDNGANINGDILPAFTYFGPEVRGLLKKFNLVRPILSTTGSPSILAALNVDFNTDAPSAPLSFTASTAFTWDVSKWDEAVWSGGNQISKEWATFGNIGTAASLRLLITSSGISVKLQAYDYVFEVGGIV
jgi:hypothetical protein